MRSALMRRGAAPVGLALVALLAALPAVADFGLLNVVIKVMIAAVFAMGFNLLWGQAGLLSFGHATYYALGAFAGIYAMQAIEAGVALPTPLVPLVGAAAGFAAGLVAGWFATLRAGVYFAMITVALAELVNAVAVKWEAVFGGEGGLRSARKAWGPLALQSTAEVYWLTLLWTLVAIGVLWWLQRSPLGTIVRGIREREVRVAFLGYDTHAIKTLVFAVSSAVAGLAGGLLALSDEAANMVLFGGAGSAFVVVNAITGGAGVFLGPVVGAALTTTFAYYVAGVTHFWMLYLGLLFIAVVLYAPHGLAGGVLDRARAVTGGRRAWITAQDLRVAAGCLLLAVATVLFVELVGRLCAPEYEAARRAAGGGWPAVRFAGVAWPPLGVWPWLLIAVLGWAGARLVRMRAATGASLGRVRGALAVDAKGAP